MSYMLDRLNSKDDEGGQVEKLETELERVRNAFQEYLSTTKDLEVGVNKELHEMQDKLKHSTSANDELGKKLRSMELILRNLELSSEGTKERLKTEAKMRRQAEKALMEAESELKSKDRIGITSIQMRQIERIDSSPLRIVDSGVITEMVSNTAKGFADRELETVTEQLSTTQEKLRKTEEQLKMSQALTQDLERNLQNVESDETPRNQSSGDDKSLLRELDEIRAEVDAARSEIQSESPGTELSKRQVSNYEAQLEESREENSRLNEEIACFRDILYDQDVIGNTADERPESRANGSISMDAKEKILKEANEKHQHEINSLREQFEETLNENADLQDKVEKLESENSSPNLNNDDNFDLQEEIDRLNDELQMAQDEHERAISETEAHWRNKLQQESSEKFHPEEIIDVIEDDDIIGVDFANDYDEKSRQAETMLKQSQKECSEMRSEVLALTESLYDARQSQSQSRREAAALAETNVDRAVLNQLKDMLTGTENEVEDKKREIITLENSLMSTQEEVRLLSEEISYMSGAFEKAQHEYNFVVEELDKVQDLYETSCIEAEISEKVIADIFETEEMQELKDRFNMLKEENLKLEQSLRESEDTQSPQVEETQKLVESKEMDTDTINSELGHAEEYEQKATMDALEKTDFLLCSVNNVERHHETLLQTSNFDLTSTSLKAEEIRRKVAFLIYALQKSKKEHSDVLLRLKSTENTPGSLLPENGNKDAEEQDVLHQHNAELQRKLEETENALAAARNTKISHEMEMKRLESAAEKTPQKNAEICLLRTQFKKLNEKNETLARQVKDAESEVLSVREKQDRASADAEARALIAKELQDEINRAVGETNKRNHEVDELTTMMENRMSLTEKSVEMLDKEISVATRTLQTSQAAPLQEKSKPVAPVVVGRGPVSIFRQSVGYDSNTEIGLEKNDEREQKPSNEWLVHKYKEEKDEQVKAAISATMSYLSASSMRDNDNETRGDITSVATDERPDTMISGVKDTVISVDSDARQSPFEGSPHLLEISETIKKLTSLSKASRFHLESQYINEDDQTAVATASSLSTNSVYSTKTNSKYEDIIRKVANYDSISSFSEANQELEARGDVGMQERE